jgi:hypothetical protein
VALLEPVARLEDGYLQLGRLQAQLIGRKDTAGTGADDDHVIMHGVYLQERSSWLCHRYMIS